MITSESDPFDWALESQFDETHVNWRLPSFAKLYGYAALSAVFLRQNNSTVASWCLIGNVRPDSPAEYWGLHDAVALETCQWLERYGWDSCPGWDVE